LISTPSNASPAYAEPLRRALERYDEGVLRKVAVRLCKPRNQWPTEELIDRCLAAVDNPTVIDRRLSELEPACVDLLALIGHSHEAYWRVGNLVEMTVALGQSDGLQPILTLLEAGLLFPSIGFPPPTTDGQGANSAAPPKSKGPLGSGRQVLDSQLSSRRRQLLLVRRGWPRGCRHARTPSYLKTQSFMRRMVSTGRCAYPPCGKWCVEAPCGKRYRPGFSSAISIDCVETRS
jgi:hypothetical protein